MKHSAVFIGLGSTGHYHDVSLIDTLIAHKFLGASIDLDRIPEKYKKGDLVTI
jgi:hypothetical protein